MPQQSSDTQFKYLKILKIDQDIINMLESLGVVETYTNSRVHLMVNGESKSSFMLKAVTIEQIASGKAMQVSVENVQSRAMETVKDTLKFFPESAMAGLNIKNPEKWIGGIGGLPPVGSQNLVPNNDPIEKPKPPVNYQDALDSMLGLPESEDDDNSYLSILAASADVGDIFHFDADPMYSLLGKNDDMALCVHADSAELSMYFVVAFSPDIDIDEFLDDNAIIYKYLNFKRWYGNTITAKVTPINAESKLISFSAYAGTICQMANFSEPLPLLADIEYAMSEALAEVS